ncbi:hypothetical protein K443DRAFT_105350 [Laccaria amethystina LaAM-08-1]|uniref:Unplaced genomic scaffold K443scaffold_153, whole genome shotgun sequence n=1 Tax=Laccaria amethystina LaAM-08-1 TaxID=1095629 RepID=A0A0C9XJ51_9AGAR|nr:hypothetical protein K443DRAFT_105350 [Laccaria amethystina LaAM-08-1]
MLHPYCSAVAQMDKIFTNPIHRTLSNELFGQPWSSKACQPACLTLLCTDAVDGRGWS